MIHPIFISVVDQGLNRCVLRFWVEVIYYEVIEIIYRITPVNSQLIKQVVEPDPNFFVRLFNPLLKKGTVVTLSYIGT